MKIQISKGDRIFESINALFLLFLCVITLYPFIHITAIAFSSHAESIRTGLHLYPKEVDLTAILKVLGAPEIWQAYSITVWRTLVGTSLSVLVTSMGAYALSKNSLPLRKTLTAFYLFAMYFSGGMIPTFLLMRSLGLLNNRWVMVLPSLVWGFNLIIMRNFFLSLPASLEESAKIDGASDFRVYWRIIMPLSLPVVATVAMWMGVYHWNAYMDNLLYITDKSMYVLQRIIRTLIIDANVAGMESMNDASIINPESLKASTILVSTIPILCVYPFAQKYFIKGVMLGAVKG